MIQHIETEFDKLSGSRVCESAKRYRQSVEFVASISRGKPFYSRSAKAFDFPVIVSSVNVAPKDGRFFSRSLWRVLEMLSLSSIQRYGRQVTIKDLLRALRLYESREIVLPGDRNSTINVIETTLSDTQNSSKPSLQSFWDFWSHLRVYRLARSSSTTYFHLIH